jgi:hypothetical protein
MATKKDNLGFGGQWIDAITTGRHTDDKGNEHNIDAAFLEQVVSNFDPELHEPPAVIGHPHTDDPAYAWVCNQRVQDDVLQVQFCDVDPAFAQLVQEGKFKKRSVAIYLDKKLAPGGRVPSLRHVGFLGAQPPAVKGLRNITFNEGEAVTFDLNFSEGEMMDDKEIKKTITEVVKDFFKGLFPPDGETGKPDGETGKTAAFSESEFSERINQAVTAATKPLSDKIAELEKSNKALESAVTSQSGRTARSEIVSFCESLGAGKFLPAFKRMGVVEFMEALATFPDDHKVAVITFAEKDGHEVEEKVKITPLDFFKSFLQTLPTFVEFGETLGALRVESSSAVIPDKEGKDGLRKGMGIAKSEGGDK